MAARSAAEARPAIAVSNTPKAITRLDAAQSNQTAALMAPFETYSKGYTAGTSERQAIYGQVLAEGVEAEVRHLDDIAGEHRQQRRGAAQ